MPNLRSHGRGPFPNRLAVTCTALALSCVVAAIVPHAAAGDPPLPERRATGRWIAKPAGPARVPQEPLSSSGPREAVVWSYGCATLGEWATWERLSFLPRQPIFQTGLAALERSESWRPRCRLLEARLLVGLAESRLESATNRERQLAADALQRALVLIASVEDRLTNTTALLSARAHYGLSRLADTSDERVRLCRLALADLERADADHPQRWRLAGSIHLTLADTLAFDGHDRDGAREHYRRALPPIDRWRQVSSDGIGLLARWHAQVAIFSWRQGNPERAEEHAVAAQALYRQAGRPSPYTLLGIARVEHLLGQIALHIHGNPDAATAHLLLAWQLYAQCRPDATQWASTSVGADGLGAGACGLQLADLVLAKGDLDDGLALLEAVVATNDLSVRLPDRVLAHLARSTVWDEKLGDGDRARREIELASELAAGAASPLDRRLTTLWSLTRLAELRSLREPPQIVAADLRQRLEADRDVASSSAELALARARAVHLLANLEAQSPGEQALAERHYRAALSHYQSALRQDMGGAGELGACLLDLALLNPPTPDRGRAALALLHEATMHLAESAPEDPDNWYLLSEAHRAAADATAATGGKNAVALAHLESAIEAARRAVASGVSGAHAQLAGRLADRGQWELTGSSAPFATAEDQLAAEERAIAWFGEACATYRLGRDLDPEASDLSGEVRCRLSLASLLWDLERPDDEVTAEIGTTRQLLDSVPVRDGGWHVEQARLDQFEASLSVDDPETRRHAAAYLTSAVHHFEQALQTAEGRLKDELTAELEVALFNLADFFATFLQDANESIEWFRRDLALLEQTPSAGPARDANQALVLMRMGLVESELRGDPGRAAEHYRDCHERLSRARRSGTPDAEIVVRVLVGLGMLSSQLPGLEGDAEQHFRAAAALAAKDPSPGARLNGFEYAARHGLAMQYERRGDYAAAAQEMRRCIELGGKIGSESVSDDHAYLNTLSRLARAQTISNDSKGRTR